MSEKLEKNLILLRNPWLSDIKIKSESHSTQEDAKADGVDQCLYLAENQTGSYGRFGREFYAQKTGGIYMSLLLKHAISADELPSYTLLAAAAIVKAIENLTPKKPQIKWVNDIYLEDKKIAGILAESSVSADQLQIVIGVGINFSISEFPEHLDKKATSLFMNEVPNLSKSELIAEIWSEFNRLQNTDYFKIYHTHSFILGKQVEFVQNNEHFIGKAIDLSPSGELIILLENGQKKWLSSGEISLKKWT
ncbi:biotin--[acetyl-CoA-carboxylase] ligase [Lactococcus fujiensis]|uniref:biotin--[biotin carboxyl-carrier protein] ligase n=1 Tax=Lactococcus fujiensis JCM 16395 TaxID=1291764 RepID=A0A2A5RMH2_9LACT|nr:biotin--[acetyl-CoA-carboxylase] ligase [Lactococcus fujiensis]PCS00489.1 BirA family transcriptional regulator, biotin operon repressor / biotin-acetyl-CoA-carboxylase ligase [Lactococcus fujiensis JCM 16395]